MPLSSVLLETLINEPDILKACAPGYEQVYAEGFFTRPGNVIFGDFDGAILFGFLEDGRYEGHYLFTRKLRGRDRIERCRDALNYMFTVKNAFAIVGQTPRENHAARVMNRALGFRPTGVSKDQFGRDCINYVLERRQWAV